ncbi:unnamed protein product [Spirodela intermedia]|uniref:Bifunctional inhibitor/plant lipid transfer protein/seed storage helical domain-containing protein n=1 Tax=Spirodela intermedia TaxID=51605 RepID=A0A7I8J2A0_SPIIN|nr:unnamed protein product [Spirodela intermedia]CAA6664288.1 unnamed protein product [Spirodela intermedia]
MTLGQGGDDTTLPCVKQLLPCRPFIGATAPPTPMCCDPLRQMMKNEVECLCVFFTTPR